MFAKVSDKNPSCFPTPATLREGLEFWGILEQKLLFRGCKLHFRKFSTQSAPINAKMLSTDEMDFRQRFPKILFAELVTSAKFFLP